MKKKKISLFDFCNYCFITGLLIIIIYPLYYTVIASFSASRAVSTGKVVLFPVDFTFEAYQHVFAYKQLWVGYANTLCYTILGTIFSLFLTIPCAYGLSKNKLVFRNLTMTYFLIPMFFGGGVVPTYLLLKNLHLLNTRLVLIVVGGLSIYNMIVTRVYFSSSIPESLYEAADVDGASEARKFFTIALPLAKPIIAVMALFYAVGKWNNYYDAMIYTSSNHLESLQLVLRRILIQNESALDNKVMLKDEILADAARRAELAYVMKYAMVFIGSLPLLVAYPFVQKYFVKGVMIGSLKG